MKTHEQMEVIGIFTTLLEGPTGDGGAKRGRGEKPSWKVDRSHKGAAERHWERWLNGETHDADSGVHPLVHTAWRCLALAYQDMVAAGEIPPDPPHVPVVPAQVIGVESIDDEQRLKDRVQATHDFINERADEFPVHPDLN